MSRAIKFDKTESIGFLLFRSARAMKLFLGKKLIESGLNIKPEHMAILIRLYEEVKMTQKEIADFACQDKTYITRLVDFLEAQDLVERSIDKADRRNKFVHLTSKGEKFIEGFIPKIMSEIMPEATKNMTSAEVSSLKLLLNKLYSGLEN